MTPGRHLVALPGADAGAVDAMAAALRDDGAVRTAYGFTRFLESLDDDPDVVLVGRDLGDGPSGDAESGGRRTDVSDE